LGQFVTGSFVNFLLVSACVLVGLPAAAVVAAVSPIFAFMIIGIPVFPILIPFMMAGNLALVATIRFVSGKAFTDLTRRAYARIYAAVAAGAVLKFLVLWVGIVQIALTLIPGIKQPQIDAMTITFSWPQLVTALIGSSIAVSVMPNIKKALRFAERS